MSATTPTSHYATWRDLQGVSKPEERPGREAIAAAVIAQGALSEVSVLHANVSTVPHYMVGINITRLTISNCNLVELPVEWQEFPHLVYLDLSHNKIETWPILRLPAVETLNLSHNSITDESYTLAPSPKGTLTLPSNTITVSELSRAVSCLFREVKTKLTQSARYYPELLKLDLRGNPLSTRPSITAPKLKTYLADHPSERMCAVSPTDMLVLQLLCRQTTTTGQNTLSGTSSPIDL